MPPLAGWTLWITGFVGKVSALDQLMSLLVSDFFIPVAVCLVLLGLWIFHHDPNRREYFQNGRLGLEDEVEALDKFIGTLVDETLTQLEIINGVDDED